MPRFPPRKAKQLSSPLTDPMTAVMQEINGVKRKVISTAKKSRMLATHQLETVTSTKEMFSETEDTGPTNILNETKIAMETSAYNRSAAKPRQPFLDPSELQSISKLQNWNPSVRNPTENCKNEDENLKKFSSQIELLDDSKSNPPIIRLTQYKPVVWNPPLRKNRSSTETSETPAKRAKIWETEKPSHIPKGKFKEKVVNAMVSEDKSYHNLKQLQEQSVSQNASALLKLENLEDKIQGEYLQMIGFKEQSQRSQKLASNEILENNGDINYSPIKIARNPQVLEEALEDDLGENLNIESSQNSEVDLFLSQEPIGENLCPKFHATNLVEDVLASKVGDRFGENLEDEEDMETKKPNSLGSKKVNHSQALSDKDMFETENQNEDHFDSSCITEEVKLNSTSQGKTSDEDVDTKKVENKEIIDEEVFFSIEEKPPPIIAKSPQHGSQQPGPGLILTPAINAAPCADLMKTPPNQFELDIFCCQTVKRVYTETPDAELPKQLGVDQILEATEELILRSVSDILVLDNAPEQKIQSPLLNNVEGSNDIIRSLDVSITTSLVEIVKVNEALNVTNGVLETTFEDKVDKDFNVGDCGFQEGKHEEPDKLANFLSGKDFGFLNSDNESNDIFKERAELEGETSEHTFRLAEDNKVDVEELSLEDSSNLIECGNKIDANVYVTNEIDLSKKIEISIPTENTPFKEQEAHDNFSQVGISKNHVLETQGPSFIDENKIPLEAEMNLKLIENEKGVGNLLQKTLQIEDKNKISQGAGMESKKPITVEKVYPMEVDSSNSSASNDNFKLHRSEDKGKMKPYTYEIEQDFDISQSQLIEIESAIMRECRGPGLVAGCVPADGMPREAATFPGIVTGTCGEARMAGFSMPRLPPLPPLNWKKKVQEDRQKLRAAIHEISRLNAMLMSVRREVWPMTGVNPEPPASSDANRQGTGPGARRY